MGVTTTYTTEATNHKSATNDKNSTLACQGNLQCSSTTVSIAAADDDTSTAMLLPVFSSWCIKHIFLYCDAITSGTAYEVGLHTTAATPVAVDADCYATSVDLSTAITKLPIDARYEALNITTVNDRVHTNGSVTTDPKAWYWLSLTATTIGSAQGDITVIVHYVE